MWSVNKDVLSRVDLQLAPDSSVEAVLVAGQNSSEFCVHSLV